MRTQIRQAVGGAKRQADAALNKTARNQDQPPMQYLRDVAEHWRSPTGTASARPRFGATYLLKEHILSKAFSTRLSSTTRESLSSSHQSPHAV